MKAYDDKSTGDAIVKFSRPGQFKCDFIIRAYGESLEAMDYTVRPTSSVRHSFHGLCQVLTEVIGSQKKQLEYNGYYNSFLLGQLSEQEFEEISRQCAIQPRSVPLDLLSDKINIIINFVDREATPKDMAQYFECEEEDIIKSIKLLNS